MASPEKNPLRQLPSVTEVDRHLQTLGLPSGKAVRGTVLQVLERFRGRLAASAPAIGPEPDREAVLRAVAEAVRRPPEDRLRRVINATGVVVHTNLGRALLDAATLQAAAPLLTAYSNLEFDLGTGQRGARGARVSALLAQLSGAEAALAVYNNAAAVLLALTALAQGREVIVSRGDLVEIGGSFRVPDIMRQSGARLVEVGTTNRTRLADYAAAITPQTAALLKVHRSNFTQSGFVEEAPVAQLAGLARERALPLLHDLGSGSFYRFQQPALRGQPTVAEELRAGADVLTFSGDKLLGAVQAGVIVGRAAPVQAMARHPLFRSLRLDKVRMTLLEAALDPYLDPATLRRHNPTIDLLERTPGEMRPLLERVLQLAGPAADALGAQPLEAESLAGGGAAPEARLPTLCLALSAADGDATALAASLRGQEPPVIARVHDGRVLLDFRTLLPGDLEPLAQALRALAKVAAAG